MMFLLFIDMVLAKTYQPTNQKVLNRKTEKSKGSNLCMVHNFLNGTVAE
jgi:hypothetical protein